MSSSSIMFVTVFLVTVKTQHAALSCRERNGNFRQDGGLCFEVPPWQHQPVALEQHISSVRERWAVNDTDRRRDIRVSRLTLVNSEVSQYMDTVLAPFLDTYHRNIQNSYQLLTNKILRRIKEEINAATKKKQQIYSELIKLAEELNVPPICDEERRYARNIASNHVALIYECSEGARASIAKMGNYTEEMISITRIHMQVALNNVARTLDDTVLGISDPKIADTTVCLKNLSTSAVQLGYELDLSLTNARRHNEQSCEKLTICSSKAKRRTEDAVFELKDQLYQCVYA